MANLESLPVGYIVNLRVRGRALPNMPDNWVKCDGQKIKKKDYPELQSAPGLDKMPGNTKTLIKLPRLYSVDIKKDVVNIGYIKVAADARVLSDDD